MVKHPFNDGTKLAKIFTILYDGNWHCGKHELPGTQPAKAIQIIRQHGFSIENKTQHCSVYKDKTVHRRLVSNVPISFSFVRIQLPTKLRQSRYCEHCKATGERGTFIGINYFSQGGPKWEPKINNNDERGCFGCFWYDPEAWRDSLNAKLEKNT